MNVEPSKFVTDQAELCLPMIPLAIVRLPICRTSRYFFDVTKIEHIGHKVDETRFNAKKKQMIMQVCNSVYDLRHNDLTLW